MLVAVTQLCVVSDLKIRSLFFRFFIILLTRVVGGRDSKPILRFGRVSRPLFRFFRHHEPLQERLRELLSFKQVGD